MGNSQKGVMPLKKSAFTFAMIGAVESSASFCYHNIFLLEQCSTFCSGDPRLDKKSTRAINAMHGVAAKMS